MKNQLNSPLLTLILTLYVIAHNVQATNNHPQSVSHAPTSNPVLTQEITQQQKNQLLETIATYQQEISKLESQQGVYGMHLVEKLSSLGLAYQYLEQHTQAIEIFKRAIHLNRINQGLYNLQQIPMINRLIASHMALSEWEAVDKKYHYLDWLNQQNYDEFDPLRLPSYHQLSKWHLQAYALGLGKDRQSNTKHLITAHKLIERSIKLLEKNGINQDNQAQLVNRLNELTITNYLFATYRVSPQMKGINQQSPLNESHNRQFTSNIDSYIVRSFSAGKKALDKIIALYHNNQTTPDWQLAEAKVKMGDWLLLFNKKKSAFKHYTQAYQLLTSTEIDPKHLESTFGQPYVLPQLDTIDLGRYAETDPGFYDKSANYVMASLDVTPQGSATNIEIIESQPADNTAVRTQVKRTLKIVKFRPRFIAGQPTLTEKMKLRILSR